jgi:FkbM family methyltransferase
LSSHQGQSPQQHQFLQHRVFAEILGVRKRVSQLEALELLRQINRSPRFRVEFTSQFGEDCWLWDLFHGQTDGFFIEVGAYDGYTYSVSYPFEAIGWTGLLIEPILERFEKARVRRTGSRVVHAALAAEGGPPTCTFNVVDGPFEGMLSHLNPTEAITREVASLGRTSRQVTVPLSTMDQLLADHKTPIDFAVIDVEGGEIPLLQGFNLRLHRPRVVMLEESVPNPTSAVSRHMVHNGYQPVAYPWINRVYVREDETELIDRARRIPLW